MFRNLKVEPMRKLLVALFGAVGGPGYYPPRPVDRPAAPGLLPSGPRIPALSAARLPPGLLRPALREPDPPLLGRLRLGAGAAPPLLVGGPRPDQSIFR